MLVSRDFCFEAAHRLENYDGKCEALHGHSWKLRVSVRGAVGADGLAFDFNKLEREVREHILSVLDHTYLNDHLSLPSAEGVAMWVWKRLSHLPLAEIRVWETPDCVVTYDGSEEEN